MMFLFLDYDGVLNSREYLERVPGVGRLYEERKLVLDPDAVACLDLIVGKSGAGVVISSDWRKRYGLGALRHKMRRAGFSYPERVVDMTPNMGDTRPRGHEIDAWLKKQGGPVSFAILDDRTDMQPHEEMLVQTDPMYGLRKSHVGRVLSILRNRKTGERRVS